MNRVTATEASRSFAELLNRARYGGESFVIERNGEPVAELRPPRRASTVSDLVDFLERSAPPDPEFRSDIAKIVRERKHDFPRDRWAALE